MKKVALLALFIVSTCISAYAETSGSAIQESAYQAPGIIAGQLMTPAKKPLKNGIVLLFDKSLGPPPSNGKYWRIPDRILGSDNDGKFTVEVPEGTYYLQAAQKKADGEIGPPRERELFYFHGTAQGDPKPLIVTPRSKLKLGKLITHVWTPDMINRSKGITAVEGIVNDLDGKPVRGCLVFAYLSEQSQGRATFVSERTDDNGRFLLRVLEGTYYLKVRSVVGGGPPEEGEYLNITSEFTPAKVTVAKNQKLKGIELQVKKFSRGGSTPRPSSPVTTDKTWGNLGNLQAQ